MSNKSTNKLGIKINCRCYISVQVVRRNMSNLLPKVMTCPKTVTSIGIAFSFLLISFWAPVGHFLTHIYWGKPHWERCTLYSGIYWPGNKVPQNARLSEGGRGGGGRSLFGQSPIRGCNFLSGASLTHRPYWNTQQSQRCVKLRRMIQIVNGKNRKNLFVNDYRTIWHQVIHNFGKF